MIGEVVSTRVPKMVTVRVERIRRHRLYKKAIRKTKRFAAHNESLTLAVGDRVEITDTKPISKTKHFNVVKKL
jgi:small subunit ribosomal protein S17